MRLQVLIAILSLLIAAPAAHAEPLSRDQVPEPLRPWTDWVLRGHEDQLCPAVQNADNDRFCLWPSRLTLTVNETGGRFAQEFNVYRATFTMLPGGETRWPLDVRIDGKPAPVISHNDGPAIYLNAGNHRVEGSFAWDRMPQILPVPAETGLVSLTVDGAPVDFPTRESGGQLWLRRSTTQAAPEGLEAQVQRRVVDSIPLLLVTRIELNVSGKDREVTLGKALPAGFVPIGLESPLPARVESDGLLRVQLRPGTWTIKLTARHAGPVNSLSMPGSGAPWPAQEIWAFEARNNLRLVSVEGVPAVNPSQTPLPAEWRQFPAFLMRPGKAMHLVEQRRGDTDPAPDRLYLERTLWLDFNGGGYTVHDKITGTMSKSWRLDMAPSQQLGRVAIGGIAQVITRRAGSPLSGVEIRQAQLQMAADSRIDGGSSRIPAVGWEHDFKSVSAMLNLPPGWRLFRASGVDDVSASWVTDWTLFDLFLVLFTAMIVYRMWGLAWGGVALLTLALTYPEPGAPEWIWLALLAAEALHRIVPKGRGTLAIQVFRWAAAATFVLIAIPFAVDQVRTAIYPALESPENFVNAGEQRFGGFLGAFENKGATMGLAEKAELPQGGMMGNVGVYASGGRGFAASARPMAAQSLHQLGARSGFMSMKTSSPNSYALIDPNAIITTGPGVPRWNWRSVRLNWRGPVQRGQAIRLWLLSPWVDFLLAFLRVGLIALLAYRVFFSMREMGRSLPSFGGTMAAVLALCLLAPPFVAPVRADFPSEGMLKELQRRLLENHDCSPNCASIPRMAIEVQPASLVARIEIDAAAETAIPLPGSLNGFNPAQVTLDGKNAGVVARTPDGLLWLLVPPGTHQALVEGPLPQVDSLELQLPLKPHRAEASSEGWTVEGISEDGIPASVIRLVRQAQPGEKLSGLQPGEIPPFVAVTRSIQLGLQWEVDTTVDRMTPSDTAITLHVPLLPGESVTSSDTRVENGKVAVTMPPSVTSAQWHSRLKITPAIALKAPNSVPWTEIWRIAAAPIWHLAPSGIPEIYQPPEQNPDRSREWRPWPGESVSVAVTRPEGIGGATLTIDSSRLEMSPGLRATDVTVTLDVRSSRGGQKSFVLPDHAELQSLTINGVAQPIRQQERNVAVPIVPGRQTIGITWREPHGIGWLSKTPEFSPGAPSVNAGTIINMPADRWTLLVAPALLGPAVLFWGLLLVFGLVSIVLGQFGHTPLRARHWFLLSLGLTQVPIWWGAVVVAWLLALGWRKRQSATIAHSDFFHGIQVLLAALTLFALGILFYAIQAGLLGLPQMQISGYGSSANHLQWFHDRIAGALPQVWAVSVPLMVYRLAMLLWALWLATALLSWLRWGWESFSEGGLLKPADRAQASHSQAAGS
ncbi:MAG: hypothetical protein ACREQI_04790 [Candidatus Binataceae bacterium]